MFSGLVVLDIVCISYITCLNEYCILLLRYKLKWKISNFLETVAKVVGDCCTQKLLELFASSLIISIFA